MGEGATPWRLKCEERFAPRPRVGTLISLTLFLTLNFFNFLAAAIAITVGAVVYVASRPARLPV